MFQASGWFCFWNKKKIIWKSSFLQISWAWHQYAYAYATFKAQSCYPMGYYSYKKRKSVKKMKLSWGHLVDEFSDSKSFLLTVCCNGDSKSAEDQYLFWALTRLVRDIVCVCCWWNDHVRLLFGYGLISMWRGLYEHMLHSLCWLCAVR